MASQRGSWSGGKHSVLWMSIAWIWWTGMRAAVVIVTECLPSPTTSESSSCSEKKASTGQAYFLFLASCRLRLRDFLSYSLVAWIFLIILFFHWSPYVCLLWTCLILNKWVGDGWRVEWLKWGLWKGGNGRKPFKVYKRRGGKWHA